MTSLLAAVPMGEAPQNPTGFWGAIAAGAEWFSRLFTTGGETFGQLVAGIIPTLIVLLTVFNTVVRLIGPERIESLGERAGRPGLQYYPLRYLVLPILAVFFLTNPMAYTMGRFLPERFKPAFYDSAVSYVHPPLGIFPHVNPGEYFVWAGIAAGITARGLPLADLAVRYLLVGAVVIFIRGIVTELITARMIARRDARAESEEEVVTP
jgi:PTS system glucitol/sorbitol-specific IIC component